MVCVLATQVSRLEEEVSSLKAKLAGLRNQCQSLKQEVTVTQKVSCTGCRGGGKEWEMTNMELSGRCLIKSCLCWSASHTSTVKDILVWELVCVSFSLSPSMKQFQMAVM